MQPGDIVKRKDGDYYGIAAYSTFGISIHMYNEQYGGFAKTLGTSPDELYDYWEVVSELPADWTIGEMGCPQKIKANAE